MLRCEERSDAERRFAGGGRDPLHARLLNLSSLRSESVLRTVSESRGQTEEHVARITTRNAERFFGLN